MALAPLHVIRPLFMYLLPTLSTYKRQLAHMNIKAHSLANLCFFAFCLCATNQASWPLVLLLFSFILLPSLLSSWLISGGFAWRNTGRSSLAIRGPFGWPLLGSIPIMGPLAHRKLAEMSSLLDAKRLMALSLGATRVIISSHPDTAKEILCGQAFSDRPAKEAARALMFERAIGFAPSGEYWRHLRQIAAANMFSPKRIASLEWLRQRVAGEILGQVGREMVERGAVELRTMLQKGSLKSVVRSVFGDSTSLEGEELGLMIKEGYDLIGKFNWGDYFPLGCLDFYGVRKRSHKLAVKVKASVGKMIEERRREGECKGDDFLSVLLTLPKDEQLSNSDMVAVLWEMIFRGTDTVAILLEWAMARMVLHPEIQAKAQQEIDACIGDSRQVRDSDVVNLRYVQAIVKEVLRMHPPGPLLSWARLATHDAQVGKHFVPAGTTAMVNMWAIMHDGSVWKDPWTFRPERFLEEEVSIMGSDLRLAPFGAGRRVCPGKALGLATVHLWLARLLHHFTWLPLKPVDLSESLRLSLEMRNPLRCRAVQRNDIKFM